MAILFDIIVGCLVDRFDIIIIIYVVIVFSDYCLFFPFWCQSSKCWINERSFFMRSVLFGFCAAVLSCWDLCTC